MELIGCEDETQTPTPDSPTTPTVKPYKVIGVDVRLAAQIVAVTPDGVVVLTQHAYVEYSPYRRSSSHCNVSCHDNNRVPTDTRTH